MQIILLTIAITLFSVGTGKPSPKDATTAPSTEPVEVDCDRFNGSHIPVPVVNSRYRLLQNGTLCCPLNTFDNYGNFYCISDEVMETECRQLNRGVVYEPCYHCKTCAKLEGETCEGPQNSHGFCDSGLECIGTDQDSNGIGACTVAGGPPTNKDVEEKCGGRFNCFGNCSMGLACVKTTQYDDLICIKEGENGPM